MSQLSMFPGKAFSPETTITATISSIDTVIAVADITVFPPAPNYATLGAIGQGETVQYSAIVGSSLSNCVRGIEGSPITHLIDTPIARNWTNADWQTTISNIGDLNTSKADTGVSYTKAQSDASLLLKTDATVTADIVSGTTAVGNSTKLNNKTEPTISTEISNKLIATHARAGTVNTLTPLTISAQSIYGLTFLATAGFVSGDTILVGATSYVAYTGAEIATEGFKTGEVVTVNFDKAAQKAFFKAGGGVNKTLPPQIESFSATAGDTTVELTWFLPLDVTNYSGLRIVRKATSAPLTPTDGVTIELSNLAVTYADTGLTNGVIYYYRSFPYNATNQFQTELTGAVISVEPRAGILISTLPVGTLVVDLNSKYYGVPVMWTVGAQSHPDYSANSTSLVSNKLLTLKAFDAKEPDNVDGQRKTQGNNQYALSNQREWLNSNATAGNWYSPTHPSDEPPTGANVGSGWNPYENQAGFLNGFSTELKDILLSTNLIVAKPDVDGGGQQSIVDKVFLLSNTEVGLANQGGIAEGSLLPLFVAGASGNASRLSKPTQQAVDNSNYTYIQFNATSNWKYWLRTPLVTNSCNECLVLATGGMDISTANIGNVGIRPTLNIPNTSTVDPTPNIDGAYVLDLGAVTTIKAFATTGSLVTAKLGATILTGTAVNGEYIFTINQTGSWEVYSSIGGSTTASTFINVTYATEYKVITGLSTVFGTNSWTQIGLATEHNMIPSTWIVGSEKDITLSTSEVLTMQIYGINHDFKSLGGKAGLTLGMKNLMTMTRAMNLTETNVGGFTGSAMFTWLQGALLTSLPSDLKSVLKTVNKKTSAGNQSSTINTDAMKIFLFSQIECFGVTPHSFAGEGTQYPIFTDDTSRIKKLSNGTGTASNWWGRSPFKNSSGSFATASISGVAQGNGASSLLGVNFGFSI